MKKNITKLILETIRKLKFFYWRARHISACVDAHWFLRMEPNYKKLFKACKQSKLFKEKMLAYDKRN